MKQAFIIAVAIISLRRLDASCICACGGTAIAADARATRKRCLSGRCGRHSRRFRNRSAKLGANRTHAGPGGGQATHDYRCAKFKTRWSAAASTCWPTIYPARVRLPWLDMSNPLPSRSLRPERLRTRPCKKPRRVVTAAILRYLQEASGSDDPWTVDVELTDAQAQAVLADVHHVQVTGGQPPFVGRQKFEIEIRTDKGPATFTLEAQSRHAVGRGRHDRAGAAWGDSE